MNYGYILLGLGATAAIGFAAWSYLGSSSDSNTTTVQPKVTPATPTSTTGKPSPPPTPSTASTTTQPKTHTTPTLIGHVDTERFNSIVAYWRRTHPDATQAQIDEEYNVELWNNTATPN